MAVEFVVVSALEPILTALLKTIAPFPDLVTFKPPVVFDTVPPNVVCPAVFKIVLVPPRKSVFTPILWFPEELLVMLPDMVSVGTPMNGVNENPFEPLNVTEAATFCGCWVSVKNAVVVIEVSSKTAPTEDVGTGEEFAQLTESLQKSPRPVPLQTAWASALRESLTTDTQTNKTVTIGVKKNFIRCTCDASSLQNVNFRLVVPNGTATIFWLI